MTGLKAQSVPVNHTMCTTISAQFGTNACLTFFLPVLLLMVRCSATMSSSWSLSDPSLTPPYSSSSPSSKVSIHLQMQSSRLRPSSSRLWSSSAPFASLYSSFPMSSVSNQSSLISGVGHNKSAYPSSFSNVQQSESEPMDSPVWTHLRTVKSRWHYHPPYHTLEVSSASRSRSTGRMKRSRTARDRVANLEKDYGTTATWTHSLNEPCDGGMALCSLNHRTALTTFHLSLSMPLLV